MRNSNSQLFVRCSAFTESPDVAKSLVDSGLIPALMVLIGALLPLALCSTQLLPGHLQLAQTRPRVCWRHEFSVESSRLKTRPCFTRG